MILNDGRIFKMAIYRKTLFLETVFNNNIFLCVIYFHNVPLSHVSGMFLVKRQLFYSAEIFSTKFKEADLLMTSNQHSK